MSCPSQILFVGPPGAGKGTQAKALSQHLNLHYCSTGAVLRREEQTGSTLGEEIHHYLRHGNYVPDALVLEIVRKWISEVKGKFVLDGFPRTVAQAEALDQLLSKDGIATPVAILLEVPGEVLEDRVASRVGCDGCGNVWSGDAHPECCPECGGQVGARTDDSVELYRARLAEYERKALPLVPFYESKSRLRRVSGHGIQEVVFQRILASLGHP